VRGLANQELTPDVALALGRAAVEVLEAQRFVIGRDTRRSGPMLEAALVAGICAAGADVELLGVVPTPTVAWASARSAVPGAMISASHNPFGDNGIKLFAPGGIKLPDNTEARIEARYRELLDGPPSVAGPTGARVGTVTTGTTVATCTTGTTGTTVATGTTGTTGTTVATGTTGTTGTTVATVATGNVTNDTAATDGETGSWADRWVAGVCASIAPRRLDGLTVVLDCAHGAAFQLAPRVFRQLGAAVTVIGDQPDGININAGYGSTDPARLVAAVVDRGADIGLAFDGDADRLIAVDETGAVVDGDRMLAILAVDRAERGRLAANTVVVTVMTNLGFHLAMQRAGISVVSTAVGDRYVLQALDEQGLSLGGEQSGHVICRDLATTGDGVLTGVQLLDVVARSPQSLSKLAADSMTTVPQILRNIRLPRRDDQLVERLAAEVAAVEQVLGSDGRVLVRASGTEPLLRIMVEHLDPRVAQLSCDRLVAAAQQFAALD
jgi:phosphoglucosamine mutase